MYVYIIVYILIIGVGLLINRSNLDKGKRNLFFCLSSFLILFILLALRNDEMGIDLTNYFIIYGRIKLFSWTTVFNEGYKEVEKGYVIYNKVLSTICPNDHILLIVSAFLALFTISLLIYKESDNPLFSFIVYMGLPIFVPLFSTLRQIIAIGICSIGLIFVIKKKFVPFIICVAIAYTFHQSSLVFLVAYPLYYLRIRNKKIRLLSFIIPFIFYICRNYVYKFMCLFLPRYTTADSNGSYKMFLVMSLIYIFCSILADVDNPKINGLLNIFFVCCCIESVSGLHSVLERLAWYFMIPLIILIPSILEYDAPQSLNRYISLSSSSTTNLVKFFVAICFIAFGLYTIYSTSWAEAYPYILVWDNYIV